MQILSSGRVHRHSRHSKVSTEIAGSLFRHVHDGPDQCEDRFGYEMHRILAEDLPGRSAEIREIGLRNLARMQNIAGSSLRQMWLGEWDRLLSWSDEELAAGMLRLGELGNDLRSITPFAGALSQSQRLEALRRARSGRR